MKNKYLLVLFFSTLVFPLQSFSQNPEIMGYLPYYRFGVVDDIEFDKLTQVCIAFANPTADTSIVLQNESYEDYDDIVDMLHEKNISVFISLAGGAVYDPEYQRWIDFTQDENLGTFVHKIMDYCRLHNLDGVDFDLEWNLIEDVGSQYEDFVVMLADSLWAEDKMIMGTFPGTYRYNALTDLCLATFEQINLMSYNLTGPWDPDNPGPHAPYSFAVQSINYWKAQNLDSEKLLLGVPFYGFDFGNSPVSAFTYNNIVNQDPNNAYTDQVGLKYYNGIPTIQEKTILSIQEANGIMIWELGQDHFGEYSLLNAIYEQMHTGLSENHMAQESIIEIFPNPVNNILNIRNKESEKLEYAILSVSGQVLKSGFINGLETENISIAHFNPGIFILQLINTSSGNKQNRKIMKI